MSAVSNQSAAGGVRGAVASVLRGIGAGLAEASHQESVQADRASIYPFEAVTTATGMLKKATANVKGVNRVTNVVHTVAGFGLLIGANMVSGGLASPGAVNGGLLRGVADALDGGADAQPADASNPLSSAFDGLGLK